MKICNIPGIDRLNVTIAVSEVWSEAVFWDIFKLKKKKSYNLWPYLIPIITIYWILEISKKDLEAGNILLFSYTFNF